ncbi:MAG: translation initiation factor IF-2 [Candidatus Terrybacteria bacterium]|nr:translation initiation factor IF-2 [Candidatus Terrybacteria bacterium]
MKRETQNLVPRPPVVAVMGHIDHGKSKLLDYIRKSNVVEKEAGGITQHIGAYEAEVKCDISHKHGTRKITFLDTPGHEAFSQMRIRGAKIADVAILVIAADEGVKPQTMEAYEAIKNAGIPFVVALNKIDKPNADPERIKTQLAEKQIFVEGYGGNTPAVNISAKAGEGIDDLLDVVLLLAEMENLKADSRKTASGIVIESKISPRRGISATLLIQNGVLKKGMFVVSGSASGGALAPVRIFENFQGLPLEEASFSSPVKIVGFDNMPEVGAEFKTFNSKKEAEEAVKLAKDDPSRAAKDHPSPKTSPETEGKIVIPIIIKTDVTGSLEALEKEIMKMGSENTIINVLRKGIGNVNEDDTKLASSAKNPVILGFNIETDLSAKELAERFGIIIFTSNIIYRISEWLAEEIKKREESASWRTKEEIIGLAKIIKTFSRTKNKQVVGGKAVSGKIIINAKFKIKRKDAEIGEGKILELQRNKMPVKEVDEGDEFGMMTESKIEITKDDEIILSR